MEATKYRNAPGEIGVSRGLSPQIGPVMHDHSIPLFIDDAMPATFRFEERVPLSPEYEFTPICKMAPLAPVRLVEHLFYWQWEVVRCPYCGRSHSHNIPPRDHPPHGDPRRALGGRVSHCTGVQGIKAYARSEYRLVAIVGTPSRVELDLFFPRVERVKRETRSSFTPEIRDHVWAMSNGRCWYCGIQMNPFTTFSIDHVHPIAKGGTNDINNLRPCCKSCNSVKGDRSLDYLRRRLGLSQLWFEKNGGAQ